MCAAEVGAATAPCRVGKEYNMLSNVTVQPMLPVKDLKVAGKFYEETLGLKRVDGADDEAVVYQSGDSTLCVYRSEFAGTNKGTAALWGRWRS